MDNKMKRIKTSSLLGVAVFTLLALAVGTVRAQQKPNIILILSDDFGYGDSSPYGGGPGRGMPTPSLERMANEGMTFFSFYAQPRGPACEQLRAIGQTDARDCMRRELFDLTRFEDSLRHIAIVVATRCNFQCGKDGRDFTHDRNPVSLSGARPIGCGNR